MDGQTNVGYMLIPKCFTLDGNGVLGLEVRERLEREDEKLCVCWNQGCHQLTELYVSNEIYGIFTIPYRLFLGKLLCVFRVKS